MAPKIPDLPKYNDSVWVRIRDRLYDYHPKIIITLINDDLGVTQELDLREVRKLTRTDKEWLAASVQDLELQLNELIAQKAKELQNESNRRREKESI